MKIYLAGRVSKRPVLQKWQDLIELMGHEVVSRWSMRDTDHTKIGMDGLSKQAADDERMRFAIEDIEDIDKCDLMISLMEEPRGNGRGGRHIEFGYALAKRKRLMIVGPMETVFHHLPEVEHFFNIHDCLSGILFEEKMTLGGCD